MTQHRSDPRPLAANAGYSEVPQHFARGWSFGLLAIMFSALTSASCFAQSATRSFDDDFDDVFKPWREIEVLMPSPPSVDNLVEFYTHPANGMRFSVDRTSIAVGSDDVVRYTLVSVSRGGARNVSFEGIRCEPRQKKLYAFGRPDGGWSRSRNNRWLTQPLGDRDSHHAIIFQATCNQRVTNRDTNNILFRLRNPPSFDH